MPRIETYTAKNNGGVISLPEVSPDSFGRQAFQGLQGLGDSIKKAGDRLQHTEDALKAIQVAGDADLALEDAVTNIAKSPAYSQHADMLATRSAEIHDQILKDNPDMSPAVQHVLAKHMASRLAPATINLLHAGQVLRTQNDVANYTDMADRKMQEAAMERDPGKAQEQIATVDHMRSLMVESGAMSKVEAQKDEENAKHRYWSIFAQTRPQEFLDGMKFHELTGSVPKGMDAQHKSAYINIAVSAIHAQQQGQRDAEIAQAKAQKEMQEQNASSLAADVLEGKPIQDRLAAMVRTRMVDDGKVSPLLELQSKMTQVPDMKQYQRGLASGIEADLSKTKYDNQPFDPHIYDSLQSAFVRGAILKDEFIHLSGVAKAVEAHKMDEAKTPKNSAVAHAAANLEQVLESANKLTGFSAIGNQATASAKEYFYRRVDQEPNANPWEIMHDAEKRFKPIVEKQQGISSTDQMLLNDAKREAGVRIGTISKAAAMTYSNKEQAERGQKIVSDALKALPPPPPPGLLERLGDFFRKKPEHNGLVPRREPGVMGE